MEIKKDLIEFAKQFKRPITFLLGVPEASCTDRDAAIFIEYVAGPKVEKFREAKGELNLDLVKKLMAIPREQRNLMIMQKVATYFDRHNIVKNALNPNFEAKIPFSDLFKSRLQEQRKFLLRDYMGRLHKSVDRLNAAVHQMAVAISDENTSKIELRKCAKEVRASIQSCEFHLKSGVAMAIANGIHPQKIRSASQTLYLNRADRMVGLFSRVDAVLRNRGMTSNLSNSFVKRQGVWNENWRVVFENYRKTRGISNDHETKRYG
ncbi:hypothetical protein RYA05_05080 [Pseudomonas syringae pv. actinidiae]|nr:hypothetical protein [Pseudomonas syringae pv. actinidiae]